MITLKVIERNFMIDKTTGVLLMIIKISNRSIDKKLEDILDYL